MEIFAAMLGLGAVAMIAERRHKKRFYSPGQCKYCMDRVRFDWKSYRWYHVSTGEQYAATPYPIDSTTDFSTIPHPAMGRTTVMDLS